MSESWTAGDFKIAIGTLKDGPISFISVSGETWKTFGVNRHNGDRYWIVTHLPSGYEMGWFRNKAKAKRYCQAIDGLTDWSAMQPGHIPESLTPSINDALVRFDAVRLIRFEQTPPATAAARGDGGGCL